MWGLALISAPRPGFLYLALLGALVLLATAFFMYPGCTGPASATPCDFLKIADAEVAPSGGFRRNVDTVVLDYGSSAVVRQVARSSGLMFHSKSVMIDRRSCRVCPKALLDAPTWEGRAVLARRVATEEPVL